MKKFENKAPFYSVQQETKFVNDVMRKVFKYPKEQYTQEAFDCAFNPQYIIDVLKNVGSEKVSFSFVNASQPVLIEPVGKDDLKYVIMPVRI